MRTVLGCVPLLVLACSLPARAQAPAEPSACDRLAGEEQRRCLALEEQRRREYERLGRQEDEPAPPKACDALFGPEKELCLKRGGTVRASKDAPASGAAGASAAPRPR
jgi:hypothetical protein